MVLLVRALSVVTMASVVVISAHYWVDGSTRRLDESAPSVQGQNPVQDPKRVPPPKPEEETTIRLGTQLVNVLFTATDKQNRYLGDLLKENIEVLENDQRQEIFTFRKEFDLPLTLAMLIDVSGSERYTLPLLKDAGGNFVDSVLRPGKDTAAVVRFEGEATVVQGMTSNPSRIRNGLDELSVILPPPSSVFGGATPPINGRSRQGGTAVWDSIVATCSDLLASEPGRKTIILLTDGRDTNSRLKIGDAIDEALRAEVVIYSIGIGDPGFGGVNEGALIKLSEATGGQAIFPRRARDLDKAFIQLEQDLRQQYLLAYEPRNDLSDGTFRKIEIRVTNHKEARIRHRRGYYAPKG